MKTCFHIRSEPVAEPLQDVRYYVCPDLWPYRPPGLLEILPQIGQSEVCTSGASTVVVNASLLTGLLLVSLVALAPRQIPAANALGMLIAAANLLGWVPLVWLIWHAIGGMETSRHVFAGTMAFRLATIIAAAEVADLLLKRSVIGHPSHAVRQDAVSTAVA